METTFRLNSDELTIDFLNSIKTLFQDQKVEITVKNIDLSDADWSKSLTTNPTFDFLLEEAEDIYSLSDGKAPADEV